MSIADDVITKLQADATLMALLTGGIYGTGTSDTAEDAGEMGISHDTTPNAFNGIDLKPCGLVKARDKNSDGVIQDVGVKSYRQVVELWLYDDAHAAWTTLEAAAQRAFVLLDEQRVGSALLNLFWVGDFARGREAALGDALRMRSDFAVRAVRGA